MEEQLKEAEIKKLRDLIKRFKQQRTAMEEAIKKPSKTLKYIVEFHDVGCDFELENGGIKKDSLKLSMPYLARRYGRRDAQKFAGMITGSDGTKAKASRWVDSCKKLIRKTGIYISNAEARIKDIQSS